MVEEQKIEEAYQNAELAAKGMNAVREAFEAGWNTNPANQLLQIAQEGVVQLYQRSRDQHEVNNMELAWSKGYQANPAKYTEEDLLRFHELGRDNPQLTCNEILDEFESELKSK